MAYRKDPFELTVAQIQEYVEKNGGLNNFDIAKLIIKEHEISESNSSVEAIRKRVSRVRTAIEEGRTYDKKDFIPKVDKERYNWNTIYGKIDVPVSQVDELFYEYSRHGLDMSQTAIINKHNLEAWQWQSIKRKLQLVKDSNIFSPHTVGKYKGKELSDKIEQKIARKYENKGALVEEGYKKQTLKAYERVINENEKKLLEKDIFYNEIMSLLPKAKINASVPVNKSGKSKNIVVTLADLHLGARVEHIQNTPDFNPVILEKYLNTMAIQINQRESKEVTLAFMGDLIESFTGLNHKNSWKGIEYGYFGSTVVIKTVELITRFISKVNNVKLILGVSGNHDRSTSDKSEDTKGEIATIVFYMLGLIYKNKIEIDYHHDVVSREIDGIQYILTHGHLGEAKKSGEKIVNEYGNNKKFNLVLTGHLHSRIIKTDSRMLRHIWCPSLFTGNDYSKQLGFSSTAGYLLIENNGKGFPNVLDVTL
jgi:predicted phosphodiesterase